MAEEKDEKTSRCWPGFEPVPGKGEHEQGSCRKKSASKNGGKEASRETARKKQAAMGGERGKRVEPSREKSTGQESTREEGSGEENSGKENSGKENSGQAYLGEEDRGKKEHCESSLTGLSRESLVKLGSSCLRDGLSGRSVSERRV